MLLLGKLSYLASIIQKISGRTISKYKIGTGETIFEYVSLLFSAVFAFTKENLDNYKLVG